MMEGTLRCSRCFKAPAVEGKQTVWVLTCCGYSCSSDELDGAKGMWNRAQQEIQEYRKRQKDLGVK